MGSRILRIEGNTMMDLKFCALIVLLFSCVNGSRSRFDVRCDSTAVCIDQLYYPYDVSGIKPICQNHQCVCSPEAPRSSLTADQTGNVTATKRRMPVATSTVTVTLSLYVACHRTDTRLVSVNPGSGKMRTAWAVEPAVSNLRCSGSHWRCCW